ncbi:MAG: hypothetical protein PHF25_00390 [Candidatus Margulisbacteria bacterium]|nr:hypothetical protein [Candidatus Margulisiibacteriota bacterium]
MTSVEGAPKFYFKQVAKGFDATTSGALRAVPISAAKISALLNDTFNPSVQLNENLVGQLEGISVISASSLVGPSESVLDRLLDGVSQIQGDSHFTKDGLEAVKEALNIWLTASDDTSKATALETLQGFLKDGGKVGAKDVWVIDAVSSDALPSGIISYAELIMFQKELKMDVSTPPAVKPDAPAAVKPEASPEISPDDEKVLISVLSLQDFVMRAKNPSDAKALDKLPLDKLPSQIRQLFTGNEDISDTAKVAMLRMLALAGYFGESTDYEGESKGVFKEGGQDVSISWAGGTAFRTEFFKPIEGHELPHVDRNSLIKAITAMCRSFESVKMRGSTVNFEKFSKDFISASAYSITRRSTNSAAAADHLARQFSSGGHAVTADQMTSLANNFAMVTLPLSPTAPFRLFGPGVQLVLKGEELKISVQGDNNVFYEVVSFKKADWDKFLTFMTQKNPPPNEKEKELLFLNILEMLAQGDLNEMTIYRDEDVKETEDINLVETQAKATALKAALASVKGVATSQELYDGLNREGVNPASLMYWDAGNPAVAANDKANPPVLAKAAIPPSWKSVFTGNAIAGYALATSFNAGTNYQFSIEGYTPTGEKTTKTESYKFELPQTFTNAINASTAPPLAARQAGATGGAAGTTGDTKEPPADASGRLTLRESNAPLFPGMKVKIADLVGGEVGAYNFDGSTSYSILNGETELTIPANATKLTFAKTKKDETDSSITTIDDSSPIVSIEVKSADAIAPKSMLSSALGTPENVAIYLNGQIKQITPINIAEIIPAAMRKLYNAGKLVKETPAVLALVLGKIDYANTDVATSFVNALNGLSPDDLVKVFIALDYANGVEALKTLVANFIANMDSGKRNELIKKISDTWSVDDFYDIGKRLIDIVDKAVFVEGLLTDNHDFSKVAYLMKGICGEEYNNMVIAKLNENIEAKGLLALIRVGGLGDNLQPNILKNKQLYNPEFLGSASGRLVLKKLITELPQEFASFLNASASVVFHTAVGLLSSKWFMALLTETATSSVEDKAKVIKFLDGLTQPNGPNFINISGIKDKISAIQEISKDANIGDSDGGNNNPSPSLLVTS